MRDKNVFGVCSVKQQTLHIGGIPTAVYHVYFSSRHPTPETNVDFVPIQTPFFASAVVKVPHFCNPLAFYFYYNIFYFNTEAASFKDMKDNRTSAVMVGPTIDSLSQYVIEKTWKNVSNYLEKMGILF